MEAVVMTWSHRIEQFKAGLQEWKFQWWFNVPILVFPINFVALMLTGGGHAPYAFYAPLVALWGPLLFIFRLFPDDMYFRQRWGEVEDLSMFVVPSLLYLLYLVLIRFSPPTRRWRVLLILVSVHVLTGAGVFTWLLASGKF